MNLKRHPDQAAIYLPLMHWLADFQGRWSFWAGNENEISAPLGCLYEDRYDERTFFFFPPDMKPLSLFRLLHRKGYIGGCPCGCRGDFEITDKGLSFIGRPRTKPYTGY